MKKMTIDAVLFDLDGCLIDTSDDLAASANALRAEHGLPAVDVATVLGWVGDGAPVLAARALGVPVEDALAAEGLTFFREHYTAHRLAHARPDPGVESGLRRLRDEGKRLAVVSNKPVAMCVEILDVLGLADHFATILGGDSAPVKKPDPALLHLALERVGVPAERSAMVGDGAQDILAGRAAGCLTVAVTWGFRSREEIEPTGPDRWIDRFEELHGIVRFLGPTRAIPTMRAWPYSRSSPRSSPPPRRPRSVR